jgi:hypothetical protein
MPDPTQFDPDIIRVALDHGEVVELDDGTQFLQVEGTTSATWSPDRRWKRRPSLGQGHRRLLPGLHASRPCPSRDLLNDVATATTSLPSLR